QNILYRNQGNGTFRNETKERGLLASKRWSTGCAFTDYNRDGYLDLVVVHYVDFDLAHTPRPGDKSQCQWKDCLSCAAREVCLLKQFPYMKTTDMGISPMFRTGFISSAPRTITVSPRSLATSMMMGGPTF